MLAALQELFRSMSSQKPAPQPIVRRLEKLGFQGGLWGAEQARERTVSGPPWRAGVWLLCQDNGAEDSDRDLLRRRAPLPRDRQGDPVRGFVWLSVAALCVLGWGLLVWAVLALIS